ncbi:hypothetical protein D3C76_1651800 [compost metagenome]
MDHQFDFQVAEGQRGAILTRRRASQVEQFTPQLGAIPDRFKHLPDTRLEVRIIFHFLVGAGQSVQQLKKLPGLGFSLQALPQRLFVLQLLRGQVSQP